MRDLAADDDHVNLEGRENWADEEPFQLALDCQRPDKLQVLRELAPPGAVCTSCDMRRVLPGDLAECLDVSEPLNCFPLQTIINQCRDRGMNEDDLRAEFGTAAIIS